MKYVVIKTYATCEELNAEFNKRIVKHTRTSKSCGYIEYAMKRVSRNSVSAVQLVKRIFR